ncbi:DUF2306 domain-containing protein [Saccharospirillum sp. HFRX-1]|uniref:DUF2306 domain-containing protein n=1 Tax=unclassified Saccharospirillum TaxID=2633430 RepID=UPI00371AA6C3
MTAQNRIASSHYVGLLLPAAIASWLLIELLFFVIQQPVSTVTTLHACAALIAVILGTLALTTRKGSWLHRLSGYCWVVLLTGVAISSFWLRTLPWFPGGFGPIHILSVYTLICLVCGVIAARKHRVKTHRSIMLCTHWGLLGAGIFTLLPHRLMGVIAWG